MSIQYDKELFSNDSFTLKVNYSGIKNSLVSASDLTMSLYAFDKATGEPIFSETLNFSQIKSLYEHLNQISILRDTSQTVSGKFIETTDEILGVLNELKDIKPNILKLVLDKIDGSKKTESLISFLSALELDDLSATHKHNTYRKEIENLEKLLLLEEAGNIVQEIKEDTTLNSYIAGQPEKIFQNWIKQNLWVFGVEYIKLHDARKIAIYSEADLMMESTDGFLDLIELKRPNLEYNIFKYDKSHKSYYPSPDLSKAIGQCLFYLQKMDEYKLNLEREYKVKILRPRIKLIAGRTNNFNDEEFKALRMLNSNLNHIQIISYEYLLSCGRKIISLYEE